jgi:ABC-type transport system involved in cytochrome bd biosynthesis fused ATPase/permease subunit
MKFSLTSWLLAVALIIFNVTLLDYRNPFQGDSVVAFIGLQPLCAVLILLILKKKIEEKSNEQLIRCSSNQRRHFRNSVHTGIGLYKTDLYHAQKVWPIQLSKNFFDLRHTFDNSKLGFVF